MDLEEGRSSCPILRDRPCVVRARRSRSDCRRSQRRSSSQIAAVVRHACESLRVGVLAAEPFMSLDHEYVDRDVALDVWTVSAFDGEPRPLEGQQLDWVAPEGLAQIELLPADTPIVERLMSSTD